MTPAILPQYLQRPITDISVFTGCLVSKQPIHSRNLKVSSRLNHYWAVVADALARVKSYLSQRSQFEPNPYYQGRYLVALLLCAYNHVAHPYEVAEVMFRSSRLAQKIEGWLADRCERFPYLAVRFDGSLGEWKKPQVMAPKKPVENVKAKKASAA